MANGHFDQTAMGSRRSRPKPITVVLTLVLGLVTQTDAWASSSPDTRLIQARAQTQAVVTFKTNDANLFANPGFDGVSGHPSPAPADTIGTMSVIAMNSELSPDGYKETHADQAVKQRPWLSLPATGVALQNAEGMLSSAASLSTLSTAPLQASYSLEVISTDELVAGSEKGTYSRAISAVKFNAGQMYHEPNALMYMAPGAWLSITVDYSVFAQVSVNSNGLNGDGAMAAVQAELGFDRVLLGSESNSHQEMSRYVYVQDTYRVINREQEFGSFYQGEDAGSFTLRIENSSNEYQSMYFWILSNAFSHVNSGPAPISDVPEPHAWALLIASMAVIGSARKRVAIRKMVADRRKKFLESSAQAVDCVFAFKRG